MNSRPLLSSVLIACVCVSSCGKDDSPPLGDPSSLCDGSAGPTLHIRLDPQPGRLASGSIVREENGLPSLVVDGGCRYWVTSSWAEDVATIRKDRELRTGVVTKQEAAELAGSFPRSQLSDSLPCGPDSTLDKPARVVADPTSVAACVGGSERFDDAWNRATRIANGLWQRGTPVVGPLRVATYPQTRDFDASYDWPLAESPERFEAALGNAPGVARLVDGEADVKKLREVRARHLLDRANALPDGEFGPKVVIEDGRGWTLYMRDACPHDLPSGLLPF